MQNIKLPLTIDALHAAQKRLDYCGVYTAQQMVRLASAVVRVDSDVQCHLSFAIDNQRLVVLHGDGRAAVILECQRCGQQLTQSLSVQFMVSPVANIEQAAQLPQCYEPVEMNEFGEIDLLALVEDELIVSLPVAPVHDTEYCAVSVGQMVFGELPEQPASPFAALADLKRAALNNKSSSD